MSESESQSEPAQQTVEQRLEALEERVCELEAENATLREELHEERDARRALIHAKGADADEAELGSIFIAGRPVGTMLTGLTDQFDRLSERIDEARDDLLDRIDERAQEDAKLRRTISALADKAGVEVHDSDIMGDDKIRRVIKHGPSDVVSGRVYPVHNRATDLLRNIDDWATLRDDANGRRFDITATEAKQRLKDKRDEQLTPTEIKRVFEKIEDWGADSPRHVKTRFSGKAGDGKNRLVIGLEEDKQ